MIGTKNVLLRTVQLRTLYHFEWKEAKEQKTFCPYSVQDTSPSEFFRKVNGYKKPWEEDDKEQQEANDTLNRVKPSQKFHRRTPL
jgi:hypothetical protein